MSSHRKYNWPQLFSDVEQSCMNQTECCKERGLNVKYFNQKWTQHKRGKSSAFVPVKMTSPSPMTNGVVIELGSCTIRGSFRKAINLNSSVSRYSATHCQHDF